MFLQQLNNKQTYSLVSINSLNVIYSMQLKGWNLDIDRSNAYTGRWTRYVLTVDVKSDWFRIHDGTEVSFLFDAYSSHT